LTTEIRRGIYEDDSLLAVCSAPFADLYRLWEAKRGDRLYPTRGDFDPIELKPWLGRVTLLDVLPGPPMDFRYRLCGSQTVEEFGIDLTGRCFSQTCFIGTPRTAVAAMSEFVRRGKVRYRNDPVPDRQGFVMVKERMYLPLSSDGRSIDIILCYQEGKVLVHPMDRR
jgi:hypothetical protein